MSNEEETGKGGQNIPGKKPTASATKNEIPTDLVLIGAACQVRGEIRNCRRLEIEGLLEGDLETDEIIVRKGGKINGHIKTKVAEIHGEVEGDLFVEDLLDVRKTGTVSGDVDYGKLAVATGGQLIGHLKQTPKVKATTTGKKRNAAIEGNGNGEDGPSISKIIDGLMHSGD